MKIQKYIFSIIGTIYILCIFLVYFFFCIYTLLTSRINKIKIHILAFTYFFAVQLVRSLSQHFVHTGWICESDEPKSPANKIMVFFFAICVFSDNVWKSPHRVIRADSVTALLSVSMH